MSALIKAADWHSLSKCECVCVCVFVPVLWSLSSREIGAALRRRWPSSHPSFHLPSYLSLPPPPLSSATVSCLISPLLPLTQMLSKQLPCISMHLCARAPFQQKQLVCIFGCRRLISDALSALIITRGPEALWPLILCHTLPALQTRATVASKASLPSLIMSSVSSKIVRCGRVPDSPEVLSTARLLTPAGQQLRS